MSFHETFWVITGTAAPVIALAAVIGLTDNLRQVAGSVTDPDMNPATVDRDKARPVLTAYLWQLASVAVLGGLNLLSQAVVLLASLLSVSDHRNWMPPGVAISFTVLGILTLACNGIVLIGARFDTAMDLREIAIKRANLGTDRAVRDAEPQSPDVVP